MVAVGRTLAAASQPEMANIGIDTSSGFTPQSAVRCGFQVPGLVTHGPSRRRGNKRTLKSRSKERGIANAHEHQSFNVIMKVPNRLSAQWVVLVKA